MNKPKTSFVPIIIIAAVILFFIGFLQKLPDMYFLGVLVIAVTAYFIGKQIKK